MMHLIFTTEEFEYEGISTPGFPLILDNELWPAQPATAFLINLLLESGKNYDLLTWEAYGRRLFDFIAYLDANNFDWDDFDERAPGKSPLSKYKAWSLTEVKVSKSTLNGRLGVIVAMYEWGVRTSRIKSVPFSYAERKTSAREAFLQHAETPDRTVSAPDVFVRAYKVPRAFLTQKEIDVARKSLVQVGGRLLFELMVRVGLRSCEARSFPRKYVFDPSKAPQCKKNQSIRVLLKPKEMEIKFDKEREVDVPFSLMEELHAYTLYERNRVSDQNAYDAEILILNEDGVPYTKDSVVAVFKRLSTKVGFRVTALMLRHSYAIHTLMAMRNNRSFVGEPLLELRDRLGHSHAQTTMTYLDQLNRLSAILVNEIEDEYDDLFGVHA